MESIELTKSEAKGESRTEVGLKRRIDENQYNNIVPLAKNQENERSLNQKIIKLDMSKL